MPRKVNPNRFRGEAMTLHPIGDGDYVVVVDDLRAGRIMFQVRSSSRGVWFWTLTGPYLVNSGAPGSGESQDLAGAKTAIRAAFDRWLATVLQTGHEVVWH